MSRREYKIKFFNIIVYINMFLFALNFKGKISYLFVGISLLTLMWMYKSRIIVSITKEFIILLICFICFFLIYSQYFTVGLDSFLIYLFGPPMGYFVGYHLMKKYKESGLNKIFTTISWGLFLHGMLNMFVYFKQGSTGRIIPDFWIGSGLSATLQGTYFTIICSLLFYSIFINKNKLNKVLSIMAILFSIYSTLQTASRTLLVIIIICLIVNIALYIYLNKEKTIVVAKIISYILLITLVLFSLVKFNIFGINSIYENSALYERINSTDQTELNEDPRFDMYKKVLVNMFDYPMGGNKIENLRYAHNLWLDTAKLVGIVPFFLLVIYTIITLNTLIKFIRYKNILTNNKYIVCSIYTGLFFNFMVEPVLEGVPYMFIIMCMLNGATRRELNEARRSKYYENSMVK